MRIPEISTQRGITLVESIATLGIMSAVAVGTVMMSSQYSEDTRTTGAAEHMKTVAEAASLYVRDNRAAMMSQASATTPVMISTAALSAAGYLPPGFSSLNAFRQNVCALVLEPSTGVLNTLAVAENVSAATALDDVTLAHFASLMGSAGGGRFASDTANLTGTGGAWSMPVTTFDNRANTAGRRCDGATAGAVQIVNGTPVLAYWMAATDTADPGFLSRDVVPGNPGANTMQTNINMGGNRIANLNAVTIDAACGAGVNNGEIASGPNGEVVTCVAGLWKSPGRAYWGAVVGTFSALPACNAANLGETRRVTDINGVFLCNGLRWDAALNTSNNLVLPQHLQVAGNANISGSASISGNTSIGGSAAVSGNASVAGYTTLQGSAQVNGNTNLYGATTTHGALNANAGMNVGAGQTIYNPGTMHVEADNDLHLKPWTGGNVVIGGGGGSGNLYARGRVTANGSHAITAQSNDWSVIARDAAGGLNNAPGNSAGSLHINDAYVRSTGKWLSQSGNGAFWEAEGAAGCTYTKLRTGWATFPYQFINQDGGLSMTGDSPSTPNTIYAKSGTFTNIRLYSGNCGGSIDGNVKLLCVNGRSSIVDSRPAVACAGGN